MTDQPREFMYYRDTDKDGNVFFNRGAFVVPVAEHERIIQETWDKATEN